MAVAGAALLISGCAGTQGELRVLESDGTVRVEPSRTPGASIDVVMKNQTDLVGYHAEDKDNRDDYALRIARAQCPDARIIGEDKIETGTFATGNPSRTYFVHVKCGA